MSSPTPAAVKSRRSGAGRILIAVYLVLALASSGRSFYQLVAKFDQAPVAYTLSAVAAVVYILATIALIAPGPAWYRVARITIWFELIGVLTVGALSLIVPSMFAHPSVWSFFGAGYLLIPLALPIWGLVWLRRHPESSGA
jgi:hypothetical protein